MAALPYLLGSAVTSDSRREPTKGTPHAGRPGGSCIYHTTRIGWMLCVRSVAASLKPEIEAFAVTVTVQCPSCSKSLRAPDTLAGKSTKCPACGTSFRVPAASSQAAASATSGSAEQAGAGKAGSATSTAAAQKTSSAASETPTRVVRRTQSSAKARAAESSAAVWTLLTADGQEYGPISKAELDSWVVDGRVVAGAQLYCEGWPEWQWAEQIYPQLAQTGSGSSSSIIQAPNIPAVPPVPAFPTAPSNPYTSPSTASRSTGASLGAAGIRTGLVYGSRRAEGRGGFALDRSRGTYDAHLGGVFRRRCLAPRFEALSDAGPPPAPAS